MATREALKSSFCCRVLVAGSVRLSAGFLVVAPGDVDNDSVNLDLGIQVEHGERRHW